MRKSTTESLFCSFRMTHAIKPCFSWAEQKRWHIHWTPRYLQVKISGPMMCTCTCISTTKACKVRVQSRKRFNSNKILDEVIVRTHGYNTKRTLAVKVAGFQSKAEQWVQSKMHSSTDQKATLEQRREDCDIRCASVRKQNQIDKGINNSVNFVKNNQESSSNFKKALCTL